MHTSSHTVLYDPDGLIEAELPLDREPYESHVKAVLAWTGEDTLATRDYEQITLRPELAQGRRGVDRRTEQPRLPERGRLTPEKAAVWSDTQPSAETAVLPAHVNPVAPATCLHRPHQ